ncbi:MAG: Cthe_2314 family HEPN domain-containing protein [Candidatus Latescibacter sp.]|nr:Cthe_2314 family HEPN domain-containing protein [Candidatus Latescibacter sp.]
MGNGMKKDLLEVLLDNLKPLLDASQAVIWKGYKETGSFHACKPLEETPVEIYDIEVFYSASAVSSAISRIQQSITYIENYPCNISGYEIVHTQYDWIQYHYAFFIATLFSTLDILLILINSVFELGNPPKNCRRDIILKNVWIRETEIPAKIKELERLINSYREPRHLLLHRGRMPNLPSNSEDSLLDYLSFYNVLIQARKNPFPPELISEAWDMECPGIIKCLKSKVKKINTSVTEVFDALLPYYLTIRERRSRQNCT